jgi:hypothetical protein
MVVPLEADPMETRAILVALIVMLFWLAPKPSKSEARSPQRREPSRSMQERSGVSITPYQRPRLRNH